MKKFISYLIRFTLFLSVISTIGLLALTSSKPAISETPKIKVQRGVQQLDSTEPSQLIEMMAKDLHDKQMKAHAIMKDAVNNMDSNTDEAEKPSTQVQALEENAKPAEEAKVADVPEEEVVAAPVKEIKEVKKLEAKPVKRLGDIEETQDSDLETTEEPLIKTKSSNIPLHWGKTMLSLVFVISLMGVLAAIVKKYVLPMQNQKSINHFGGSIQILQSMVIGLKQQIMVVLVEGQRLVIGVTDHNMNLLYTLPGSPEVREATEASAPQEVIRPVAATPAPSFVPPIPEKVEPKKVATPAPVLPEESIEDLQDDPLAAVVSQAPQNQFTDHSFRRKLEAFERYQADQAHIASLREKVRE